VNRGKIAIRASTKEGVVGSTSIQLTQSRDSVKGMFIKRLLHRPVECGHCCIVASNTKQWTFSLMPYAMRLQIPNRKSERKEEEERLGGRNLTEKTLSPWRLIE